MSELCECGYAAGNHSCEFNPPKPDLPYGELDCDGCGDMVALVTDPRFLVIVLCETCNHGTPIR